LGSYIAQMNGELSSELIVTQLDQLEGKHTQRLKKINKLLLSGGSSRGYCYLGLIQYLEEIHLIEQLKYLVGTSIGALLVTMINLGYTSSELSQSLQSYDYEKYQSIDLTSIFENFGMDNFEKSLQFIRQLFQKKGYSPDINFKTLYERTHQHLIINAVCLNIPDNVFFDHIKYPDMPVILAIQASMSLPFIFASVNYQGLTYTDGGILNNFPIDCEIFKSDPESILAVTLHNPNRRSVKAITTLEKFSLQILSCVSKLTAGKFDQCPSNAHLIKISAPKYHILSLVLSAEDKIFLKETGYQRTKHYFETTLRERIRLQIEHENEITRAKQSRVFNKMQSDLKQANLFKTLLEMANQTESSEAMKALLLEQFLEANAKLDPADQLHLIGSAEKTIDKTISESHG
jgi:predicted acylesterase/phospholipase RssA